MCTVDSVLQLCFFISFFSYKIFSPFDFFRILFIQNYVILYLIKRIFAFLRVRYSCFFHYIDKSSFYSTYQYTLKRHIFTCAFFIYSQKVPFSNYLESFCLTYSYITTPAATEALRLSVFPSIGILAFSSAIS